MEGGTVPHASSPGPTIDNVPTTLHLIEVADLPKHPLRPAVHEVINRAFSAAHPPYLPASLDRLRGPDALAEALGPDAFTFVLTAPALSRLPATPVASAFVPDPSLEAPPRVLASVSGGVFTWKDRSTVDPISRNFLPTSDPRIHRADGNGYETAWEMKLMAVDPAVAGRGLASALLGSVEREIHRRWKVIEAPNGGNQQEGKKMRVFLRTIKEMNERFYLRRGYTTVLKNRCEPGLLGSVAGFSLIGMIKDI